MFLNSKLIISTESKDPIDLTVREIPDLYNSSFFCISPYKTSVPASRHFIIVSNIVRANRNGSKFLIPQYNAAIKNIKDTVIILWITYSVSLYLFVVSVTWNVRPEYIPILYKRQAIEKTRVYTPASLVPLIRVIIIMKNIELKEFNVVPIIFQRKFFLNNVSFIFLIPFSPI